MIPPQIDSVNQYIAAERMQLLTHPLYAKLQTVDSIRKFTEGHVYAVWDFMSLLKALQQKLTCTTTPWMATPNPNTRYLINEIVLAEESDLYIDGSRLSHFEMYLDTMEELQAQTTILKNFLEDVQQAPTVFDAIANAQVHQNIKDFLTFTFEVIQTGKAHEIAAAFTFGREGLIPDMFTSILKQMQTDYPDAQLDKLVYYFQRHIDLDGDEHGPLAFQMVEELCGTDEQKWKEVQDISKTALQKRILLWNAIEATI